MFLGQKDKPRAPFRALARGEGTNSARLFTPGERNALAKCKVNQISWAHGYDPRVDLLTDLKNMAVCQEWDNRISTLSLRILKQYFNFQKHIFEKSRFTRVLKQFLCEKMRRIDLLWNIVKYRASLL
jgi:hypothetical protein